MSTTNLAELAVAPMPATFDRAALPATEVPTPGIVRRLVARLALLAFGLYHVPLLLNDYPSLGGGGFRDDGLSVAWGNVFGQVGLWVARHVFQMPGPMPNALGGDNGDTAEEYCRLLVGVVVAVIVATIWTVADRRRPGARWVEEALHVLLRYSIALGLASYGMAKIYPVQFGDLSPIMLETRIGELTPMGLLWRFMEYSPVYSTIAGIMEMIAVVLLCFRRTATLGALICVPVMLNVMLMNLCYGVIVKLFSCAVFASAVVLLIYDVPRLVDVFILHRSVPAKRIGPPFRSQRLNQARWLVKLVLIGGVILSSATVMRNAQAAFAAAAVSPLHGTWEVMSIVVDGRDLTRTADSARWRRFLVGSEQAALRLEDQTLVHCVSTPDEVAHTLKLGCPKSGLEGSLHWTVEGNDLRLEGTFGGARLSASLKRRSDAEIPLLRAEFRWIGLD